MIYINALKLNNLIKILFPVNIYYALTQNNLTLFIYDNSYSQQDKKIK